MKAKVDRDGCIGCGLCAITCPQVFEMDEEDLSKVICDEIDDYSIENAKQAQEECPVSVISIK